MSLEISITGQLEEEELTLSEKLGQHFLVDDKAIQSLQSSLIPGVKVIEVGSGIGHVTKALGKDASSVVGIEIDTRFQPILEDIVAADPKFKFIMSDVLRVDLQSLIKPEEEVQVVANLPFHITEPFLSKLVDLPIESAVLLLGDNAAKEIAESEGSPYYGKLSLVAQTFFNVRKVADVPRESFYPQPRTDATIVELTPKEKEEIQANPVNYVLAYLLRRASKSTLVINDIKQGMVDAARVSRGGLSKKETNRKDRAEVKRSLKDMTNAYNSVRSLTSDEDRDKNEGLIISQADALNKIQRMDIDMAILQKPFSALNNQELQKLVKAVNRLF